MSGHLDKLIDKGLNYAKINMPSIMAGAACGFVIFSAYRVAKSSFTVSRKIDEAERKANEKMDTADKVKMAVPYFIEPALYVGVSLALILGSDYAHRVKYAGVLGLLASATSDKEALKEKIEEKLSPKKAKEIEDEVKIDKLRRNLSNLDKRTIFSTNSTNEYLFIDDYFGYRFTADNETVNKAIMKFNLGFIGVGDGEILQMPFETFYDILGVEFETPPAPLRNFGYLNQNGEFAPELEWIGPERHGIEGISDPVCIIHHKPTALMDDGYRKDYLE